jgi:protocatechuate 3,4-dioxygenase beta subunit
MTVADEPGKKIIVTGKLEDLNGQSIAGVLIYFYQTDSKGWYAADRPHVGGNEGDRRHARIFGFVRTDKEGKFELNTVKPSGYPSSDLPAHIHVEILEVPGYHPLITEFLFDDDERLVGNIREQSLGSGFLLAKPSRAEPPFEQTFTYRIRLIPK